MNQLTTGGRHPGTIWITGFGQEALRRRKEGGAAVQDQLRLKARHGAWGMVIFGECVYYCVYIYIHM